MNCPKCGYYITFEDEEIIKGLKDTKLQELVCKSYHTAYRNVPVNAIIDEKKVFNALGESIERLYNDTKTWMKTKDGTLANHISYELVKDVFTNMELYKLNLRLKQ